MQFSNHFSIVILTFLCNLVVNESSPTEQPEKVESRWMFNKMLNSIADVNKERLNALMTYSKTDKYKVADGILRLRDERDPMVAVLYINRSDPNATRLYEIHDSDLKNAPGETSVRDIIQQIEAYYDDGQDQNKVEEKYILANLNADNHGERKGKEIIDDDDGEEIIPEETSDGEEIGSKSRKIVTKEENTVPNVIEKKRPRKLTFEVKPDGDQEEKQYLRMFESCVKQAVKICKKSCVSAVKDVCKSYKCSGSMKKSFKKNCKRECKSNFK